jgi:hypothetical protein
MSEIEAIEASAAKHKWWIIGAGGAIGAYILLRNYMVSQSAAGATSTTTASGPDDAVQEASLAAQVQAQGIQAQASEIGTEYGSQAAAAEQSATDALQATIAGDQAAIQAAALQATVAQGQTAASVTENGQNQGTNQAQIQANVNETALQDATQIQLANTQAGAILGALGLETQSQVSALEAQNASLKSTINAAYTAIQGTHLGETDQGYTDVLGQTGQILAQGA